MITLNDVLQMDGSVFAEWLRINREKYDLSCGRLGKYLGVATEAVEGYEKGYFCRRVYREALFKYFEDAEWEQQQPKSPENGWHKKRVPQDAPADLLPEITSLAADPRGAAETEPAAAAEPEPIVLAEPEVWQTEDAAADAPEPTEKPEPEIIFNLAQEVLDQKASDFGAWLKSCRKSLNATQKEFGEALGFSQRSISKMETERQVPPLRKQNFIRKQIAEKWPATCGPQGNQNAPMTALPQGIPDFGVWLKEQRENLGMSQKELAGAFGFKNRHGVSQLERGEWLPSIKRQQQLKERVEQLFREKGSVQPLQLPDMNNAALPEMPSAPSETPTEKEEPNVPADLNPEPQTVELSPSIAEEPRPACDFMAAYDCINWIIDCGLYKLNSDGRYKVRSYVLDLLHNEENLESCFVDAED